MTDAGAYARTTDHEPGTRALFGVDRWSYGGNKFGVSPVPVRVSGVGVYCLGRYGRLIRSSHCVAPRPCSWGRAWFESCTAADQLPTSFHIGITHDAPRLTPVRPDHQAPTANEDAASARQTVPYSDLPKFSQPPVVEVAISVQFEALPRFQLVDFGLFWERLRDRFPKTQYQQPLAPVTEFYGKRRPRGPEFHFEQTLPLGRCWYLSANEDRLVQVQPDRFILNWKRSAAETFYPSYETLRTEFERELGVFLAFIAERELGDFEATQCEVIYVNHLPVQEELAPARGIPEILTVWTGTGSGSYLPEVEDVRLGWQYRFEENGKPQGRLHVQAQSVVRDAESSVLFAIQMTGRGAPAAGDVASILAFADQAHEWIVNGFAAITTGSMHLHWGRQR